MQDYLIWDPKEATTHRLRITDLEAANRGKKIKPDWKNYILNYGHQQTTLAACFLPLRCTCTEVLYNLNPFIYCFNTVLSLSWALLALSCSYPFKLKTRCTISGKKSDTCSWKRNLFHPIVPGRLLKDSYSLWSFVILSVAFLNLRFFFSFLLSRISYL